MSQQNTCEIQNRALLKIGDVEAESFLQGILTCNIDSIAHDGAGFGGLLTPQGKILFDFFVVRNNGEFLLDVNRDQVEELTRRLIFYRLRAKVTIEPEDNLPVIAAWGSDKPLAKKAVIVADPRLAEMGWRIYGAYKVSRIDADYDLHRISTGMPQGGIDYGYGDAFPHEALYDQTGGVDFAKGCYVGQEVISRMHHRGTARKRILQVSGTKPLPETGTRITAGEKPVGELGSVRERLGLAMLRLDRVKDAMDANTPLMADDVEVSVSIQPWVNFNWPGK